ncbi:endonuclease/exonuclease/phosphatase family protein [Dactylosporangium sp. CA-092794]|uniref:endonuclease/exonuclease/phosphatase family protein n=1 Tax=Dactylosporangium sp. CA-092794 TaxID=3239929 RepID=UPI003D915DF2
MPAAPLRMLTLNALFKGDVRARLAALGAIVERAGYDVVCLQEVMDPRAARRLAAGFAHRRFGGALLVRGGLVLLSRWPVAAAAFVPYPISRPLRPELLMRKGAQVALLDTPAGRLAVVNTHLSANRDDDWSPGNRYSGLARAELRRLERALARLGPAVPLVVTGDLNLPRESAVLAEFRAAAGLRDAMAGDPRPTYRPTPSWPTPPAFDHVLLRSAPGAELKARCRLVFQDELVPLAGGRTAHLSDHYGIETELTIA